MEEVRMAGQSNLDCFLTLTTPSVPSRSLPETCLLDLNNDWTPHAKNMVEYFNLGDLWNCYDEWSAYGVGTPITIHGETVVQYYTPYLSAIQIYTAKDVSSRHVIEDFDGESEGNSWTSESESTKLSRTSSSCSDKIWDVEDLNVGFDGDLCFEYFESDGPFRRQPLKDKIDVLSLSFPGLKELNSIDISPASWMAIAWYPIYHIPGHRSAKDLYASFLTYHTLSPTFQGIHSVEVNDNGEIGIAEYGKKETTCRDKCNSISLTPFGLATYRMQRRVWLNHEDDRKLGVLKRTAQSWLKQLQVQHHDFDFFASHPATAKDVSDYTYS